MHSPLSCLNHPNNNVNVDNNKQRCEVEPMPEDYVLIGKDIQNKSGRHIGLALTEEQPYHEFFGRAAVDVAILWGILSQQAAGYGPKRRDNLTPLVGPSLH